MVGPGGRVRSWRCAGAHPFAEPSARKDPPTSPAVDPEGFPRARVAVSGSPRALGRRRTGNRGQGIEPPNSCAAAGCRWEGTELQPDHATPLLNQAPELQATQGREGLASPEPALLYQLVKHCRPAGQGPDQAQFVLRQAGRWRRWRRTHNGRR